MTDLPKGWQWQRLSDLGVEVRGSVTPEPGVGYELYSVPAYPSRRPELIDGREIGSAKRPVEPGDVLLCKINPRINRVWIVGEPLGFGRLLASPEYLVFRAPDVRVARFLRWYLQSPAFRAWIELVVEGATGSHTRAKSGPVLEQLVPVPPLDEQERIVAAVEEHLVSIEAGVTGLASAGRRCDLLAGRVVDCAIEGEPQPLGSLLREPLRNGVSARASATGSVRVVTLTAVTRREFTEANTKLIDEGDRPLADLWMEPGDIFVERSNTPELVGTAAMFRGEREWAIFPDLLIRIRADDRVEPDYLELVLQSGPVRRYYRRSAQGIAGSMPKISQPIVEGTPVPLPSRERQRELVVQARESLDRAARLAAAVDASRRRANQLRRAILAAAFSGRLV